ncbi:hypothetical protein SDC9_187707 [bioreactor metagenome]|uniref:Glycoside Hydrolase 20C C-terminal domain-containing protein n=1 Tax=bioreactor metagenome TaxID=1076179 RepID=A0A645HM94_9ZZZZ
MAFAKALTEAVQAKLVFADAIISAYIKKDKKALAKVVPLIADYEKKLKKFVSLFRTMWHRNNKPFGLETMQVRFAGQEARIQELKIRLNEYLDGKVKSIPELDEIQRAKGDVHMWNYTRTSHASSII